MNGSAERYEYWETVSKIDGWLSRGAAIRSMDILEFQELNAICGPLLEIGVYKGKYFSVLLRSAIRTGDNILGIDTFGLASLDSVQRTFASTRVAHDRQISFWRRPSTSCTAGEIKAALGGRPRFISIDGSHDVPDVFWDMRLAEELLGDGGVVALDDFLSPVTMGVNEAVFAFFAQPRRFVPFAFIENKLFLSAREWSAQYRQMLEAKAMNDDIEQHSTEFRRLLAIDRNLVDQPLWNVPVLLFRRYVGDISATNWPRNISAQARQE
jgi:hypothetical protein